MNKIRRLDLTYKNNGHIYEMYLRSKNVASYKQFTKEGELVGIEVFVIKEREAENIGGREYPRRECYASTGDWGSTAFTLRFNTSEKEVQERLNRLQKEYDEKIRANQKTD